MIAWQLADQIRAATFKLTRRGTFRRDFRLQSQAEDAIDSVCRNIAEGFGCESHLEFARYLEISRRSLNEFTDCLHSAELKQHVTSAEIAPIRQLLTRLYPALNRFIAYLRRNPNRKRTEKRKGRRTDKRPQNRTDERQEDRTDERQKDRTDERQEDRTDERQEDRTD